MTTLFAHSRRRSTRSIGPTSSRRSAISSRDRRGSSKQTWDARPFATLDDLQSKLVAVMYAAPVAQQVALIQAHPDLVGRAALAGTLTPASTGEQAAAGLDQSDARRDRDLHAPQYRVPQRFGFPFVICARENKKESILAGFAQRMGHTRDEEIATALGEIAKICRLRPPRQGSARRSIALSRL